MVVVPKQNGEVRICADLAKLNANIIREVHPLPSVEFTLGKLGNSKVFSKLGANSAFWQLKLSEESKFWSTFITPWGRFCFERLPYSILTGSEQFHKVTMEKLEGGRMPNWWYPGSWWDWESGPTWSVTARSLETFVWFKHHTELRKVWIPQNSC